MRKHMVLNAMHLGAFPPFDAKRLLPFLHIPSVPTQVGAKPHQIARASQFIDAFLKTLDGIEERSHGQCAPQTCDPSAVAESDPTWNSPLDAVVDRLSFFVANVEQICNQMPTSHFPARR
jgi:hypothetical protein